MTSLTGVSATVVSCCLTSCLIHGQVMERNTAGGIDSDIKYCTTGNPGEKKHGWLFFLDMVDVPSYSGGGTPISSCTAVDFKYGESGTDYCESVWQRSTCANDGVALSCAGACVAGFVESDGKCVSCPSGTYYNERTSMSYGNCYPNAFTFLDTPDHEFDFRSCSASVPDTGIHGVGISATGVGTTCSRDGMVFDESDDYVSVTPWSFGGAITVEAYVKYSTIMADASAFSNRDRVILDFGDAMGNDNVALSGRGSAGWMVLVDNIHKHATTPSSSFFEKDRWVHVVATAKGTDMKLYRNGYLNYSITNGQEPALRTRNKHYIGKSWWTNNGPFDGTIAFVRVWHGIALKEEEIYTLYSSLPPSLYPPTQVNIRVADEHALSITIEPPDTGVGANITHYKVKLFDKPIRANVCTQWKHVLDRSLPGNKSEVVKSPFGIYRITDAATIASSSSTNVYVYDKNWAVHTFEDYDEINYWYTRGTTEKTYPKCSRNGGSWVDMWPKSGPHLCPQYSCTAGNCVNKTIHVSAHQGGNGGWIFWHKGAQYSGASCHAGNDQVKMKFYIHVCCARTVCRRFVGKADPTTVLIQ